MSSGDKGATKGTAAGKAKAKPEAVKAAAAKKAALKGTNAGKIRKVRTSTTFRRPKTLRLSRNPKYPRKSIPHAPRMDAYKTIIHPLSSESAMAASGVHKVKPPPSPKPEKLHARAISQASANLNGSASPAVEALADRFAKLRGYGQTDSLTRPDSRGSNSSVNSLTLSRPAAGDYGAGPVSAKPQGPRGMPDPCGLNGRSFAQCPTSMANGTWLLEVNVSHMIVCQGKPTRLLLPSLCVQPGRFILIHV